MGGRRACACACDAWRCAPADPPAPATRPILRRLDRRGHATSPLTNEPLAHKQLVPCVALRRCVAEVLDNRAAARRSA